MAVLNALHMREYEQYFRTLLMSHSRHMSRQKLRDLERRRDKATKSTSSSVENEPSSAVSTTGEASVDLVALCNNMPSALSALQMGLGIQILINSVTSSHLDYLIVYRMPARDGGSRSGHLWRRVLVVAPSNAAADEVARRVMQRGFVDGEGRRYYLSL